MSAEAVKVIVRCRPMNQRENDLKCKNVVKIDSKIGQCALQNPGDQKAVPKSFTFDGAYDVNSTTEQIYADIGYPLVEGVTEGYNGTIFAYGQTGCGKSFSMQGITDPATQRGIIPRAFDHIFETITVSEGSKYLVHASYLEIYNEEIRDLLGKDVKQKLELKEHPDKGVYVQTLSMHPCKNVVDCQKVMDRGWKNRATGSTLMNADSSRSHSIFTIHLERCETDDNGEDHIRAAKLNLVDLAGSERQAKTGATGDRLKEATKINLSLSALGNVISALVDGKSKHIPYRDSKLTRLLQDSLGGNTKTLMVACLSPADNNYDETLSTLRYANRAKNIKNKPKINEDPKDALLREYQAEIEKLRAMLRGEIPAELDGSAASVPASATRPAHKAPAHPATTEAEEAEKERLKEEYEEKMAQMKEDFEEMRISKAKLEEEMARLQDAYSEDLANVSHLSHIHSPGQHIASDAYCSGDHLTVDVNDPLGTESSRQSGPHNTNGLMPQRAAAFQAGGSIEEIGYQERTHATNSRAAAVRSNGGATTTAPVSSNSGVSATAAVSGYSGAAGTAVADGVVATATVFEEDLAEPRSVTQLDREISSLGHHGNTNNAVNGFVDEIPGRTIPIQTFNKDIAAADVNGELEEQYDDDSEFTRTPRKSHAVHVGTVNMTEGGGVTAPRSSPTGEATMTHIQHEEAIKRHVSKPDEAILRLQELQQVMVGGEEANNEEIKEKRKRKKKYAEERKRKLQEELAKMDGEDIMLDIYDNIHDELKAKDKLLKKSKDKNEGLHQEVLDLQSEFEFQRIDYLDTIRKQEEQMKWLQAVIDKIHPCLRRDCNYVNLDRIKVQSKWDSESLAWTLPKMTVEKSKLPPTVGASHQNESQRNGEVSASIYDDLRSEDRYLQKLNHSSEQDMANAYFKNKRAEQLLNKRNGQGSSPVNSTLNGFSGGGGGGSGRASPSFPNAPWQSDPMTHDQLRAAQVHGQISAADDFGPRKPQRLEALAPVGGKSGKRKKNRPL